MNYSGRGSRKGCFSFGEVKRSVFEKASKFLEENDDIHYKVTLYYDGSNLCGVMDMQVSAGESAAYKKALKGISNIVAENC